MDGRQGYACVVIVRVRERLHVTYADEGGESAEYGEEGKEGKEAIEQESETAFDKKIKEESQQGIGEDGERLGEYEKVPGSGVLVD